MKALALVGLGEHQRELLAADPGGHVDAPLPLSSPGDGQQGLVARLVALRVVDVPEVVAVADDEANGRPLRAARARAPLEQLLERAPVEQAGEGVGAGGIAELADQPADSLAQAQEEHPRHPHRAGKEDDCRDVLLPSLDPAVETAVRNPSATTT